MSVNYVGDWFSSFLELEALLRIRVRFRCHL